LWEGGAIRVQKKHYDIYLPLSFISRLILGRMTRYLPSLAITCSAERLVIEYGQFLRFQYKKLSYILADGVTKNKEMNMDQMTKEIKIEH
jgi:hypothetical protein